MRQNLNWNDKKAVAAYNRAYYKEHLAAIDRRERFDSKGKTQICLTQGKIALVDPDVFDEVNKYKWCAYKHGKYNIGFVASRYDKCTNKVQSMHQFIWFLKTGKTPQKIDHINHDSLDNRFENLRSATSSENSCNQRIRLDPTKSSVYKGVCFDKSLARHRPWLARIQVDGKTKRLGYFATEEEARDAYDLAAVKLHGEFAATNKQLSQEQKREEARP